MTKKFRILILEDSMSDVEAILYELRLAQLTFEAQRVDTETAFLAAVKEFEPDVILSDYKLPRITALDALRLLRESYIDTPLILYTEPQTEKIAVECMKQGAADYILKSNLERLPSAITNILEKNDNRQIKQTAFAEVRESEHKLRTLLESMSEALLQVNNDEVIEFVNRRFCEMTGYQREELLGKVTLDFLFDEEGCKFVSEANRQRYKAESSHYELRLRKKTDEMLWTIVGGTPIIDTNRIVTGTMRVFTDITERKNAEEQLLHDAFHDPLTGLANRAFLMHHLRLIVERRRKPKNNLYAVLFLDFDRFKFINDSLGHAEGDKLLKYIARRLESCVRDGDLAARLGGDEFVILLPELAETSEALLIAERILNDLKHSFDLSGNEIFMTTSIGIALSTAGHARADEMLHAADIALYHAKANGKAQYQVFDPKMQEQAARQTQFEVELRRALERSEFCLDYQPIINLETGELIGFEALVRWNHPTRGKILPEEFVPVAEENRLILPLGKWILQESCRQMRQWQDNHPSAASLILSVNVTRKQFLHFDFAEQVAATLRVSGLDAKCLKIEILESHIIENTEVAAAMMTRLRALGVEIILDDFGTGYSSLSYLRRFPADYLKIDCSFISQMTQSRENGEIVHAVIKLAQNLKIKVIAEGVETGDQLELLQLLDCEYGQGHFLSKPLTPETATELIGETLERLPGALNQSAHSLELNV